uniref:PAS domain-containing protein n=1 Tax=Chromera velia CCMP2878 TaxID=1169474 RepID=A0A0G4I1B0_9ALVE|eukprot:Cvel_37.t1-p1 / transcript=Cvel_37.t1 / gene=Cvel_37 / organism=Chromera_velia_CCMP2878 / gene_product=Blue-light photoreceptor, putative / transcript_product=Blue-light photoreceptor, putative / location=Cvel_scaffold5:204409-208456(+) / protein_length=611 / sequence_SO=supercontig / SO=protein_coding / is_pseudo=false
MSEAQQQKSFPFEKAIENYPLICGRSISLTIADPTLPDCPLIGCSHGFTDLTGYTERDILGKNCRFLSKNCDIPPSARVAMATAIRNHESMICVIQNSKKEGGNFKNMLYLTPFHCAEWSKTYIIGIQADVTDIPIEHEEKVQIDCGSRIGELFRHTSLIQWIKEKVAHFEAFEYEERSRESSRKNSLAGGRGGSIASHPQPPEVTVSLPSQRQAAPVSKESESRSAVTAGTDAVAAHCCQGGEGGGTLGLPPPAISASCEGDSGGHCPSPTADPPTPRWLVEEQIWALLPATLPDKLSEMQEYNEKKKGKLQKNRLNRHRSAPESSPRSASKLCPAVNGSRGYRRSMGEELIVPKGVGEKTQGVARSEGTNVVGSPGSTRTGTEPDALSADRDVSGEREGTPGVSEGETPPPVPVPVPTPKPSRTRGILRPSLFNLLDTHTNKPPSKHPPSISLPSTPVSILRPSASTDSDGGIGGMRPFSLSTGEKEKARTNEALLVSPAGRRTKTEESSLEDSMPSSAAEMKNISSQLHQHPHPWGVSGGEDMLEVPEMIEGRTRARTESTAASLSLASPAQAANVHPVQPSVSLGMKEKEREEQGGVPALPPPFFSH